jgi:hypothetical protein
MHRPGAVGAARGGAHLAGIEQVQHVFDRITDLAARRSVDAVAIFESGIDGLFE